MNLLFLYLFIIEYLEENKMSGCGCSFSAVEEVKEEVKYTDELAEQFAKEVGVDQDQMKL